MATKTYRLARSFCEDHWERDCGVTDKVIHFGKRLVTVEMDIDGYNDMLSDAEYYWDCRHAMDAQSLVRSARAVRDALLAAGAPE